MTTGRINQVTILKTTAKLNTRPRPLALQRVRSNSRKFQIDMKLQRHRSQAASAQKRRETGPVPLTARLVLSLAASPYERPISLSSHAAVSRLAVSAPSVDAFSCTLT